MPALVITLGTLYIYRGINVAWTGSDRINASDLPADFRGSAPGRSSASRSSRSSPSPCSSSPPGYSATSQRPRVLRDRLRPVRRAPLRPPRDRRILAAFVVGALAGLAGVLYAARYGTVSSAGGTGWELQAIGAAVIGGVAISGVGTVWGAAIGACLLLTINRALPILGIQDFWQRAVVGALIIGAIVLDRVLALRQSASCSKRGRKADDRHRPAPDTRTARTYQAYSSPLWRRVLLTREMAIIVLLVAVIAVALAAVPNFDSPLGHLPAAGRRADPAHRTADDAHHHHRGDRPLGRERSSASPA